MSDQMKVSLPEVHDICRRLYRQWREARITSSHDGIEAKSYVVPITSDDVMQLELAVDSCFEREQLPNEGRKLLAEISQRTGIRDDRLLTVDPEAWSQLDALAMDRESTMSWYHWHDVHHEPRQMDCHTECKPSILDSEKSCLEPVEPNEPLQLDTMKGLTNWANAQLATKQRTVIVEICKTDGKIEVERLANHPSIDWGVPYKDSWNSIRKELNRKLRQLNSPWILGTKKGHAVLVNCGQK